MSFRSGRKQTGRVSPRDSFNAEQRKFCTCFWRTSWCFHFLSLSVRRWPVMIWLIVLVWLEAFYSKCISQWLLPQKHVMSISYATVTSNEPNVNSCCILAGVVKRSESNWNERWETFKENHYSHVMGYTHRVWSGVTLAAGS